MNQPLVEKTPKSKTNHDVLIIDADPESVERITTVCEKLERFRFIITAKDGSEAAAKLNKQKFKLILLDLKLPKKNGIELLKIIQNSENSLSSVVIVSTEIAQEQLKLLVSKGLKQIMVKPFEPEMLRSKIQNMFA